MATLLLSLGSNLGHRESLLATACDLLALSLGAAGVVSDYYESDPEGFTSSHRFLNCAARFDCGVTLAEAADSCRKIERLLGRTEKSHGSAYADRPIDIDLLAWDDAIVGDPALTLPHPRLAERPFVLLPLADVAGGLRHPASGRTYADLAAACPPRRAVRLQGTAPRPCRRLMPADITPQATDGINRLLDQLSPGRQPWQADRLRGLLGHDTIRLLVIDDGKGTPAGMASLVLTPQLTGRKGRVEDVVVEAGCRRRGLGARLMANVLAHAAREGLDSLELTSRPAREAANSLYGKSGFGLRQTNVYHIGGEALGRWHA